MFKESRSEINQLTVKDIKKLGKDRTIENFNLLINLFGQKHPTSVQREIVSSIGRHKNNDDIYRFIKDNVFEKHNMEVIYQMFRTLLYKSNDTRFFELKKEVMKFYDNEVINKMDLYYTYKHEINSKVSFNTKKYTSDPVILKGNNIDTLKTIPKNSVQLIFTSPPYYNARDYSGYLSYKNYLKEMKKTLKQCHRVLETGRFIVINVSPVITGRPGREFESTRYPIPFDFHQLLIKSGFTFVDEIIWVKPEPSVPYRIGGYMQIKKPLTYKPKTITESILVYRKNAPFLVDENLKRYNNYSTTDNLNIHLNDSDVDSSNCWYIPPTYNKKHPAVFPKKLCEKILKYYSFPNDIVLDPFAGIGTFGTVAIQMKRIPILCESNPRYIETMEYEIRKALHTID